jgi:1-acyl-sn-glycerol-3-phosphate acyltransferase
VKRAPLVIRVARTARVGLHVIEGLALTLVVFPFVDLARRREIVRHWSARLLAILHVETRPHGLPEGGMPGNVLIVANHVSWLDIFVLLALSPVRFVAKADIRRWPVVGRLAANAGTLFVERERRRHAHSINREAARALARGDVVAIFPEGTTTDGTTILPFKGSLLQPIVDAGGHVQPVALRYRDPEGAPTDAPAYVGETSFVASFWRVTAERALVAEARFADALPAHARHRRELAREAEDAIRKALAAPGCGSAPGTRADPAA